jgi:FAD/FMN-containing dehydrogenase
MADRQKAIQELSALLGADKVLSDDEVLKQADGINTRNFEKAFGYEPDPPLFVVKAFSTEDVSKTLKYCNENDIDVITKTGATSSEDQLVVTTDKTIFLDASPINQLIDLDETALTVTVGCGMPLARLEEIVNEKGYTTGHCPQSQPLAFVGGLTATRSIGQFSTLYGGIEDLVCGLEAVLPDGEVVRIRNVPRRAAGPDLRHVFIGSEGSIGVMTEITLKLFKWFPEDNWKGGYIVKDFETGLDAIREILTNGFRPSVVRLYDKPDVDRNYGSVKLKDNEAFMFFVAEGHPILATATGKFIAETAEKYGAEDIGTQAVDHWLLTRNDVCNTIGSESDREGFRQTKTVYATVEICADWGDIRKIYGDVIENVPPQFEHLVLFGGHVSHAYQTGSNIYFVYELKIQDPLKAYEEQWALMKAICDIVIKYPTGGIAHHHGVGKVRVKMIHEELGTSFRVLRDIKKALDPNNIMDPGCLIPEADLL